MDEIEPYRLISLDSTPQPADLNDRQTHRRFLYQKKYQEEDEVCKAAGRKRDDIGIWGAMNQALKLCVRDGDVRDYHGSKFFGDRYHC